MKWKRLILWGVVLNMVGLLAACQAFLNDMNVNNPPSELTLVEEESIAEESTVAESTAGESIEFIRNKKSSERVQCGSQREILIPNNV